MLILSEKSCNFENSIFKYLINTDIINLFFVNIVN